MSIKKQNSSLSKLYTLYEEVPESFLDETDVDIHFYHNIALIDNRIVRVSKGSNKKKHLLSSYFSFVTWKINKDSFLRRRCQFYQKKLQLFWTLYASFWNRTIKLSSLQPHTLYSNQSKLLVLLYSKTNSLHIISETLKNIATDKNVFLFVLSVTKSVVSPSKSFKMLLSRTF